MFCISFCVSSELRHKKLYSSRMYTLFSFCVKFLTMLMWWMVLQKLKKKIALYNWNYLWHGSSPRARSTLLRSIRCGWSMSSYLVGRYIRNTYVNHSRMFSLWRCFTRFVRYGINWGIFLNLYTFFVSKWCDSDLISCNSDQNNKT